MRAGTWATVVAILIIIAIGWWAIDWTGENTVPATAINQPAPTGQSPAQQQGQAPDTPEDVIGVKPPRAEVDRQRQQQTVGESAPPSEPRPAD